MAFHAHDHSYGRDITSYEDQVGTEDEVCKGKRVPGANTSGELEEFLNGCP